MDADPETVDPETTPRQRPERAAKNKSPNNMTFESKDPFRHGIDVVLSLKDPIYKHVMVGFFKKLGGKTAGNDAEKEAAREALNSFKNRKSGETTRFFKPESRYASKTFVEVDEKGALESTSYFYSPHSLHIL